MHCWVAWTLVRWSLVAWTWWHGAGRVERFGHGWRMTSMRRRTAFLLAVLALTIPECVATGDGPAPAAEVNDLPSPTPVASVAQVDWTCESPTHGDDFMEELFPDLDAALRSVATVELEAYELGARQDQYDHVRTATATC